jgi:hypothetical protein
MEIAEAEMKLAELAAELERAEANVTKATKTRALALAFAEAAEQERRGGNRSCIT